MRWTFTLNNPGATRPQFDAEQMQYLVYQLEMGAQGTQHLQGYVRFFSRKRLSAALGGLGLDGAHLERARGTEEQNRKYCTKEEGRLDGPWEHGIFEQDAGRQGKRSDLQKATTMIVEGKPIEQVARELPEVYVKYARGLRDLQNILRVPPVSRDVTVEVIWGPTGTGKSHYVYMNNPDVFIVSPGRSPWDAYNGQATICFDEFDDQFWAITDMNKWLDKWRVEVPARYYNKWAMWSKVYIVSNKDPNLFYFAAPQHTRVAFFRRLVTIRLFDTPYNVSLSPTQPMF